MKQIRITLMNAHQLQAGDTFYRALWATQPYNVVKVEKQGETAFVTINDTRRTVLAFSKNTSVYIQHGK